MFVCRFPKDDELRKKWEHNVRRENWNATAFSFLCSDHFETRAFDRTGQTVRLREGAEPTLFKFPTHLQTLPKTRKPPAQRLSVTVLGNFGFLC